MSKVAWPARLRRLLPGRADYKGLSTAWRGDIVAGLTVGVVALPLALAFGITSGLGAEAGLVTAIVAGLAAGALGGSRVQVSGPTGAMTVVLVPVVHRYGGDAVLVVGMMAGALLLLASVGGFGRALAYIPWPVVEGFTVGIAAIIFLQQVPGALGVPRPEGENTAAVAARAVGDAFDHAVVGAIGLTVLVAALMVVLPRLHRSLPSSLVAVAVATLAAEAAHLDVARIGALPGTLPLPSLPSLPGGIGTLGDLAGAALAIALLGGLESLLSAKVADGMSDGPGHDPDRELFGQGVANVLSPLFGGMPSTGAIARTAVNVRAGARTRLAAITHALVLLAVVFLGGDLVARIPLAALAGVLMVTAARMVEPHNVRAVLRATRADAAILVLTAVATVAFDLIVAIEVGLVVAALLALRSVAQAATAVAEDVPAARRGGIEVDADTTASLLSERIVAYRLDGALFFGAAQRFLTDLTTVADVRVVILRLPDLQVLDATGAQALGQIVAELEHRGITVLLKGVRPQHLSVLRAVGALDRLAHQRHVFTTFEEAVAHAHVHVERSREPAEAPVA